ncbi:MAG: agmatinase [Sedimentisphaerales bacterium]|nr:agmatinase [Sedimentisphaerales bacterium]
MARPIFFPDAPGQKDNSRIVILPVPFDRTSTWGKGSDNGPNAILAASEHLEGLEIETRTQPYTLGIYTDEPVLANTVEQMVRQVDNRVGYWLDHGRFVVILGGEHSVNIGSIQAHAARTPDLTILQLDAHADLRDRYKGSQYNHACVMARARDICQIAQVGIRSMDLQEYIENGSPRILFADQIQSTADWMDLVIGWLGPKVYITIDLDVFDCSIMPSTGTPEPGGLDWWQVTGLLREVCRQRLVVGLDVVELCPIPGLRGPDMLAARLIYKLLAYRFLPELPVHISL